MRKTRPALDRFHDSSKVNALVCSMLYALCSMLYALCSMLYALCSMLYALCSMLYALCSMLYALCSMLYALCTHTPTHAQALLKNFYNFIWICWQFFAAAFWTTFYGFVDNFLLRLLRRLCWQIFCRSFLDNFVDNFLRRLFRWLCCQFFAAAF